MKKLIVVLCVLAVLCCFAFCSAGKNTIGAAEPEVSNSGSKPETTHKFEIFDLTEREKKIYFYRDDLMIYGKLYLPEGEGPFPVAIFSPRYAGSLQLHGKLHQGIGEKRNCRPFL